MLKLDGISVGLFGGSRRSTVCRSRSSAGAVRLHGRAKRRRQDARCSRLSPGPCGRDRHDPLRGHRSSGCGAEPARASRHRPRAGRAPGIPVADGDGKPRDGRLYRGGPARPGAATSSAFSQLFPCWRSAADSSPARSPAASSRCWRSAAGLPPSPKLLMLDEPSMGLAPAIADFIFERLIEISTANQTHHPAGRAAGRRSARVRDHGYVLEAGRVVLEGTNATLRADDRVRGGLPRYVTKDIKPAVVRITRRRQK